MCQPDKHGWIVVEPFDRACLGPNSYDVHLSEHLAEYRIRDLIHPLIIAPMTLDAKVDNEFVRSVIPPEGVVLYPHRFYLGSTVEYTETHRHVPFLEGKSSTGRLGISIHETAGKGDVGFCNHWTMELSARVPVRVYAGMPIGQLIYHEVAGTVLVPYDRKASAKYGGRDPLPRPSAMWKNFAKGKGR